MGFLDLRPRTLWLHFDRILQIPRPSGHEARIREYILEWSAARGFLCSVDRAGNVFVDVPATEGRSESPAAILQAHLDMVVEGTTDRLVPVRAEVAGDFVRGLGTTLGADNGIGVAAALAIVDDQIPHGPLQLIFTVDEETGLTGAKALNGSLAKGEYLVNLDSEDDAIYIGCAGARDSRAVFTLSPEVAREGGQPFVMQVGGLLGGHSGVDIHKRRANAIKVLAHALVDLTGSSDFGVDVVALNGGSSRNAIPREASAAFLFTGETETLYSKVNEIQHFFRSGFPQEKALRIQVHPVPRRRSHGRVWARQDCRRFLGFILACPNGVLGLSDVAPSVVSTSNNLSIVESTGDLVQVRSLTRSSGEFEMETALRQIEEIASLSCASFSRENGYPAWEPRPSGALVSLARRAFGRLWGREAALAEVHGGLECAILGERIEGVEMISIGPNIEGAHTPGERVAITSVERFYRFLAEILLEISLQTPGELAADIADS